MKKIILIAAVAVSALCLSSCGNTKSVGSYYSYEAECMGIEMDGSETILSWGSGKNKSDALEQAKKNAINVVLFKGITKGSSECAVRPLITEVNARERHEDYFNQFFKDGGKYKKFVSMKDTKARSHQSQKNSQQEMYGIVVRINRMDLKQQLINDNIIQ